MGFVVTRSGGLPDAELSEYGVSYRQAGGGYRVPRVPDPNGQGLRWLPVWETAAEAAGFVTYLVGGAKRGWVVASTDAAPVVGPLVPVMVSGSLDGFGLSLMIKSLSSSTLQARYPGVRPSLTEASTDLDVWQGYEANGGTFIQHLRAVLPLLTGWTLRQIAELGCLVLDRHTNQTWLDTPPKFGPDAQPAAGFSGGGMSSNSPPVLAAS